MATLHDKLVISIRAAYKYRLMVSQGIIHKNQFRHEFDELLRVFCTHDIAAEAIESLKDNKDGNNS